MQVRFLPRDLKPEPRLIPTLVKASVKAEADWRISRRPESAKERKRKEKKGKEKKKKAQVKEVEI